MDEKKVNPGEQAFLYNVGSVEDPQIPQVLATAARVYEEQITENGYSLIAKSPKNTTNVMRILLPEKAKKVEITDPDGNTLSAETSWDDSSKTYFLSFENYPEGVQIKLSW